MAVEKLNKKQKKATEFRTKKRKLDDSIPDVPEEDNNDNKDSEDSKDKKKDKKEDKKTKETAEVSLDGSTADGKKKRRRGKGASKDGETAAAGAEGAVATKEGETAVKAAPKNHKFIVFVGNLPFNITKEVLEKHFESCGKISSVRVQTDKVTGKGKGFAFMEFPEVEAMQKALYFNKTLIKERPINVELTAGGGGNKSAARKQKIVQKNDALNEERRKVHEKHIAPAKEAKSSYAAANPPVVQKPAPKNFKKPSEMSDANSITVDGLASRLRRN